MSTSAGGNTGPDDPPSPQAPPPQPRVVQEKFRFDEKALTFITWRLLAAGALLLRIMWGSAWKLGFFTEQTRGPAHAQVLDNVVVVALLVVAIFLFIVGTVLLFADIKILTLEVPEPAKESDRQGAVPPHLMPQVLQVAAEGLGKTKGGATAIFGGVVLLVVAGWIAASGMAEPSPAPSQPAPAVTQAAP